MIRSLIIYFLVSRAFSEESPLQHGVDYLVLNDSAPFPKELIDYSTHEQVFPPAESDLHGVGESEDGFQVIPPRASIGKGFWQASINCELENVADMVQCLYNKEGQLTRDLENGFFKVEINAEGSGCTNMTPKCFSSYFKMANNTVVMGVRYVKSFSKRHIRSLRPNSCRGIVFAQQESELRESIRVKVFCHTGRKSKRKKLWRKLKMEVEDKNLQKKVRKRDLRR